MIEKETLGPNSLNLNLSNTSVRKLFVHVYWIVYVHPYLSDSLPMFFFSSLSLLCVWS